MQLSASIIEKFNNLSEDKQQMVVSLVEQLSMTSLDVLAKFREQGLQNPMEMDEINSFITEARK